MTCTVSAYPFKQIREYKGITEEEKTETPEEIVEEPKTEETKEEKTIEETKSQEETKEEIKTEQAKPQTSAAKSQASSSVKVQAPSTVRVDTRKLDSLMNLIGELVIAQSRIMQLTQSLDIDNGLKEAVSSMDRTSRQIQEEVMNIRMMPFLPIFQRASV